jgi:hypothetical protein
MRNDRDARRALLCGLLLALCVSGAARAQGQAEDLPDWSGWWVFDRPFINDWLATPPPLSAEELARVNAVRSADFEPEPGRYCRPPQFTGYSGGFVEAVEFLFTPGRVTITNESGMIRRIYTDGRALPADPVATNTGTSVGHWEGDTLVVETVGINPAARYPQTTWQGAMPIGEGVKITERISLQAPDTLLFEIETIAPDIFLAPDRRTRAYARAPGKDTANEITFCVEHDRSIDPMTGAQRFDMSPPADLPPPPGAAP